MTDIAKINALAEQVEKLEDVGPTDGARHVWRFQMDVHAGTLFYRCGALGLYVYCTPGFDRKSDDAIVVDVIDDDGDQHGEGYAIPLDLDNTAPAVAAAEFRCAMVGALRVIEVA